MPVNTIIILLTVNTIAKYPLMFFYVKKNDDFVYFA